ncbi:MAG: hypothetical protein ACK4E0_18980 [Chitinophagaceae bacterium]
MEKEIHRYAANLLDQGQVQQAWQVLLMQALALLLKASVEIRASVLGSWSRPYMIYCLIAPPLFYL